MTPARVPPVLVTGATGRVGRAVIDQLIDAGVPVRALTHRSEPSAALPADVEVVTGDFTVSESLDAALRGAGTVFLAWTAPPAVVGMLLAAWGATTGRPALIIATVSGILGSAPRSFRQWVADHATAFG